MRVICQLNGFKLYKAIFRGREQERNEAEIWDTQAASCELHLPQLQQQLNYTGKSFICQRTGCGGCEVPLGGGGGGAGWWLVSLGLLKQLSCTCTSAAKMKRNWMKWSSGNYKNARLKACNNYYFQISLSRHDFRCVFIATQREIAIFAYSTHCPHNCYAKIAFCTMRWAKTLISIHGQSKRGAGFAGGLIAFMVIKARKELKDIRYIIANSLISS